MAKPPETAPETAAAVVELDVTDWVVAKADLYVGHIKAVSAGELVHPDTVKNNGWDDQVEKQ